MPSPKKSKTSKALPPRGGKGRFVKSSGPKLIEMPEYSPHRVGIGERIDWQRELTREVQPPRKWRTPKVQRESNLLGIAVLAAGAIGIGWYGFSKLPSKLRGH